MIGSLAFKNLRKRPGRTAALVILSAFLCFAALAGSLFVSGLKSGLDSLETRLGADIMVVPYEAATKGSLSDIILHVHALRDDAVLIGLPGLIEIGNCKAYILCLYIAGEGIGLSPLKRHFPFCGHISGRGIPYEL